MLEKAAAIKRFEYSPLGNEVKTKTDIAKNNIQDQARFIDLIKKTILKNQQIKMKNIIFKLWQKV